MRQSFARRTTPDQAAPRLAALRAAMAREGLAAFLVPRADAHQGEQVAPRDERLPWLTGFTGSAGFAAVLEGQVGLFVDGRYRVQARLETDAALITPLPWPETGLAEWLAGALPAGARAGYDPWLHTEAEIGKLASALAPHGIGLRAVPRNLVDTEWPDQPPPPAAPAWPHPEALSGAGAREKRAEIAAALRKAAQRAAVLTLPESIAWLLNIRGADIARVPVAHCFAIVHDDGHVTLFIDPAKTGAELIAHLGPEVTCRPPEAFEAGLKSLSGPVRVDPETAPAAVAQALAEAGRAVVPGDDPCLLPKARKTEAELAGARAAQLRDGAAMAEFLCWLDAELPHGRLTEIDVVRALEGFREATGALRDIAFETIAGSGPNGAIVHYRVSEDSNRRVAPDDVLLVDSGGQYLDGTTDITRTVCAGQPPEGARAAFTRVLKGLIALSRARFPEGLAGRDLDALARVPLWLAGQDYDHGTGHGVGAYLSVHEGPQRFSRRSHVPLEPGMILSNEPGYYREGAFGIRLENLVAVGRAPALDGGDDRAMLTLETLTLAPIDRRLILTDMLDAPERAWLDAYHARVQAQIGALVSPGTAAWLARACAPL